MENNIVLSTLSKVLEARLNNDKAELESLMDEHCETTVSLTDVVFALDVILDDMEEAIDANFELVEHRMKAIVGALDEVTQARIKTTFSEHEDYMFAEGDNE